MTNSNTRKRRRHLDQIIHTKVYKWALVDFPVKWRTVTTHNARVIVAIDGHRHLAINGQRLKKKNIKEKKNYGSCHSRQASVLCGQRFRQSPNFSNRSSWKNAADIRLKYIPFDMADETYHFRTFSMAARTFLMSSLALLRVSARPDRPDILMLFWFIYYRFLWNFFFFYGFSWRLASNEMVHYRHHLMWRMDSDIYF